MKNTLLLLITLLIISPAGASSPTKDEAVTTRCKTEIKKIEKSLGPKGVETPLTAENYKKSLEALKKAFKSPSKAELQTFSKDLKKQSKKVPKSLKKVLAGTCSEVRLTLIKSLLRYAKSELQNPEIKTEIWTGLTESIQSRKYNTADELSADLKNFQEALKVFKPDDRALVKELKMLGAEVKVIAAEVDEKSKSLDFENTKSMTPEHYTVLLAQDDAIKGQREILNDIVKSTKIP